MDLGIDFGDLRAQTPERSAPPARPPEWLAIRDRLAAAHAARRALARDWAGHAMRQGSFSPSGAALLAAFGARPDAVNRDSSEIGKRVFRMILPAAGATISGGRG